MNATAYRCVNVTKGKDNLVPGQWGILVYQWNKIQLDDKRLLIRYREIAGNVGRPGRCISPTVAKGALLAKGIGPISQHLPASPNISQYLPASPCIGQDPWTISHAISHVISASSPLPEAFSQVTSPASVYLYQLIACCMWCDDSDADVFVFQPSLFVSTGGARNTTIFRTIQEIECVLLLRYDSI